MPLITTRSAASARGLGFCQQTGPRTQPISGYELWLDSSDASKFTYSSGSVVSTWTDKSTNAYVFEQPTTASAPTRTGTQNSKSTIVFDGSNDFLNSTAATSVWKFLSDGTQSTVIVVYKNTRVPTGLQDENVLLDTTGYEFPTVNAGYPGFTLQTDEDFFSSAYQSQTRARVTSGVIASGQSTVSHISNSASILAANHNTWNVNINLLDVNNATSSNRLLAYNSQSSTPDSATTSSSVTYGWTAANTGSPASTLKIGWEKSGGYYPPFKGEIAEIVMYKRKLSQAEVFEMRTYLKDKWNI
jgi:hypothetical protein